MHYDEADDEEEGSDHFHPTFSHNPMNQLVSSEPMKCSPEKKENILVK